MPIDALQDVELKEIAVVATSSIFRLCLHLRLLGGPDWSASCIFFVGYMVSVYAPHSMRQDLPALRFGPVFFDFVVGGVATSSPPDTLLLATSLLRTEGHLSRACFGVEKFAILATSGHLICDLVSVVTRYISLYPRAI